MVTLWELQRLVMAGNDIYGDYRGAPYSSDAGPDWLHAYELASRASTKKEHEIKHCEAMLDYCHEHNRLPEAVDWALSAIAVSDKDTNYDLAKIYRVFWPKTSSRAEVELAQFQHAAGKGLDRRLIGSMILRCLCLPGVGNAGDGRKYLGETITRLIAVLLQTMPDLCREIRIEAGLDYPDQLDKLKVAGEQVTELLLAVEESAASTDIHIFCSLHASVQKAMNRKAVHAVLEPFLPRGFAKTRIHSLFTLLDELRRAPGNRLNDVIPSCLQLVDEAVTELNAFGTFYAKRYMVPLFHVAGTVARRYYENSDATKPAEIEVTEYPKKYPLPLSRVATKLKFLLVNKGPGPAPLVDLSFCFGPEVTPSEATRTFTDMDVTTYDVEVPVEVAEPGTSLSYIATIRWSNYDGSEANRGERRDSRLAATKHKLGGAVQERPLQPGRHRGSRESAIYW